MAEIKLYYSNAESAEILQSVGYTVETVQSWVAELSYHNNTDYRTTEVTIAYLPEDKPSPEELKRDSYWLESNYGLSVQLYKVFKTKLARLIMLSDSLEGLVDKFSQSTK